MTTKESLLDSSSTFSFKDDGSIKFTFKDIRDALRIIQIDNTCTAVTKYFEITTPFTINVPLSLEEHSIPYFMYMTKVVTSDILTKNEHERDDFYFLQFRAPKSFKGEYVSLDLTGLTTNYPSISFPYIKINPNDHILLFDNFAHDCFNPRKRFPWVHNTKDLFGDVYRIELKAGNEMIEKYLCFDYFSYENYITVLIEIAYYQKLTTEKSKLTNESQSPTKSSLLKLNKLSYKQKYPLAIK